MFMTTRFSFFGECGFVLILSVTFQQLNIVSKITYIHSDDLNYKLNMLKSLGVMSIQFQLFTLGFDAGTSLRPTYYLIRKGRSRGCLEYFFVNLLSKAI